jgi:hypothetical protein
LDENIIKEPHPPHKFDVSKHKNFLRDAHGAIDEEIVHEEMQCVTQRYLEEAQI